VSHGPERRAAGSVFVGRGDESAVLRAAWESASGGSARVVAVEGDPGIGKTALIDRLLAEVSAPVIRVSGLEGEPAAPWGVLDDIAAELSRAGRGDRDTAPDPQASPLFVGQNLARQLQAGGSVVLVVDNAQWVDQLSMAALQYAALRLRYDPVLLLVAYRPGSPADQAEVPGLPRTWRQVFDGGHGVRLSLDGLPPEDLLRLAASNGYPSLSPEGAARLHESTGGNPDHALELLKLLSVHPTMTGSGPLPAPRDHVLAIISRLASCSRPTRDIVSAAAVLGQRFSVASLRSVTGLEAVGEHVGEAIDAGLLVEVPGTGGRELAFPRVLTREAIYHDLSGRVRAELHRRCAELGGPAALQHRIAAADGADDRLAADLQVAAREKMAAHDVPGAAFYLQRALDCTSPGPERLGLLLTAVESLLVAGSAIAAREYEGELAQAPAGPWRDYVLGYQVLLAGRVDEATALLRGALAALDRPAPPGAPADLKARVATQLAIVGIVTLDYQQMVRYGSIAVDAGSDEPMVYGTAWLAKTVGLALAGESDRALDLLADAGEPGGLPGLEGLAGRGIIRLWSDDLAGAAADLHALVYRATHGEALRTSQALGFLGEVEYRRGRLGEAVLYADLAVGNAEDNDRVWDYPLLHALACYPHAARAEWGQATRHAMESDQWAHLIGHASGLTLAGAAKAAIAQARGDAERLLAAADQIESNYDSLEPGTHLFGAARAEALAQLGRIDEAAGELERFLAGPASSGRRSALMSAARVAAQIAAGRGDADQALRDCDRAAGLARSIGMPLEAARIDLVAAHCHSLAGHRAAAERALRSARRQFIALGANAYTRLVDGHAAQWGIALHAGSDPFAQLTLRERDVAQLVCQGLTNRQTADRLYMSPKTVETHLGHVFAKLNVSSRAELRALLDQAA
jgi:DNA-binding CsgD family transcriptional regulator/tetratricopeptide (TPR) repeat protein